VNSSVIGKIEKARRYAQERDRIRVNSSMSISRRTATTISNSPMRSGAAIAISLPATAPALYDGPGTRPGDAAGAGDRRISDAGTNA
jgi:hypothetical protein